MGVVSNATDDRRHANTALEHYVTHTLMDIITVFFNSPFSDQSTTIQVRSQHDLDLELMFRENPSSLIVKSFMKIFQMILRFTLRVQR